MLKLQKIIFLNNRDKLEKQCDEEMKNLIIINYLSIIVYSVIATLRFKKN